MLRRRINSTPKVAKERPPAIQDIRYVVGFATQATQSINRHPAQLEGLFQQGAEILHEVLLDVHGHAGIRDHDAKADPGHLLGKLGLVGAEVPPRDQPKIARTSILYVCASSPCPSPWRTDHRCIAATSPHRGKPTIASVSKVSSTLP